MIMRIVCWLVLYVTIILIRVSAQEYGFISIDCGSPDAYTDATTGTKWATDDEFIKTGFDQQLLFPPSSISSSDFDHEKLQSPRALRSLRYFPTNNSTNKNCYVLPAKERHIYVIRASFQQQLDKVGSIAHISNSQNKPRARFNVSVDSTLWLTVHTVSSGHPTTHEAIFAAQSNEVYFCLINIGEGDPFISSLELRPLKGILYGQLANGSFLTLLGRFDFGANEGNGPWRYRDDLHDRIWDGPKDVEDSSSTSSTSFGKRNTTQVPLASDPPTSTLQTAWIDEEAIRLRVQETVSNKSHVLNIRNATRFLSIFYRRDLQSEINLAYQKESNKTKNIVVYFNKEKLALGAENTRASDGSFWDVRRMDSKEAFLESTWEVRSTSSPAGNFLNVAEFYSMYPSASPTDRNDVTAVSILQHNLNLSTVSTGDPCLPVPWDWIVCDTSDPPRITQLLLNSTDFVGSIPDLNGLEKLQTIYINNNGDLGDLPVVYSSKRRLLRFTVQCNPQKQNGLNRTECEQGQAAGSLKNTKDSDLDDISEQRPRKKRSVWRRILVSKAFIAVATTLSYIALIGITVFIIFQARKDLCPTNTGRGGNSGDNRTEPVSQTDPAPLPPAPPSPDHFSRESENAENATSRTDLVATGGLRSDQFASVSE